jgi:hypothetical protein
MKTHTKEKRALRLASDDVTFILEPIVDKTMAQGLEGEPLVEAVAVAAERVLRVSLTDQGLPVKIKGGVQLRTTTVRKEARRIATELIKKLTVTEAMLNVMPDFAERHGLPAAVAAAEALASA